MKIYINIIPILQAIQSEYGNDILIYRLSKIFNINFLFLINKDFSIQFTQNTIEIKDDNTTYQITLFSDYYLYTKKEKDYLIHNYYDLEGKIFRKTAIFYQPNDDPIILDEINEEELKNRRLLKTTENDKDLLNPYFEKEISTIQRRAITEKYLHNQNNTTKEITTPNHLCTYTSKLLKSSCQITNQQGILEVSSSINYFPPLFLGRIRNRYELLVESVKNKFPNILIRENIFQDNLLTTYEINTFKLSNIILIILKKINPFTKSFEEEKIAIKSSSNNYITIQDINILISYIKNNINIPFTSDIIIELIKIKNQILAHHKKRLKDIDIFDFKFNSYPRFEDLAFDIYSNLSYYNNKINNFLNPPTEKPPILKK